MKILVCISSVPDTTSKINFTPDNCKFDPTGVQFIINPNDEFCLTKAILLKEKLGATITLINVGTAETEPISRKAITELLPVMLYSPYLDLLMVYLVAL